MSRRLKIEAIEELISKTHCTIHLFDKCYVIKPGSIVNGVLKVYADHVTTQIDLDRLLMRDLDYILKQLDPSFNIKKYQLQRELRQ